MPFITEEIWQKFPHKGESIMISAWPVADSKLQFPREEEAMKRVIEVISSIRNRRSEMNVPASKKVPIFIQSSDDAVFRESTAFLSRLASASEISFDKNYNPEECVTIVTESATVFIPLFELLDVEKEIERLNNEKKKTLAEIERIEKKLSNEQFVSKAPAKVVDSEREKLKGYRATLANIEGTLLSLQKA